MELTLYSTPTCKYCGAMKKYLDKKGYKYNEVNLMEDREAQKDISSVPVLDIQFTGEPVIRYRGWTSAQHLEEFLNYSVKAEK